MNGNKASATGRVALNGILAALVTITLYLESILPVNKLSLYALSSFFIAVVIMKYGIKNGWAFYLATCLLAFAVIPDKFGLIPYAVFFGLYGIVKFYIEKLNKLIPEYILKLLYFNLCLILAIFLIREFFIQNIKINFPWWIAIVLSEIVFVIYDYVYTLLIQYYNTKLKRVLRL